MTDKSAEPLSDEERKRYRMRAMNPTKCVVMTTDDARRLYLRYEATIAAKDKELVATQRALAEEKENHCRAIKARDKRIAELQAAGALTQAHRATANRRIAELEGLLSSSENENALLDERIAELEGQHEIDALALGSALERIAELEAKLVDYTTDTALHPFLPDPMDETFCQRCTEAKDWHTA